MGDFFCSNICQSVIFSTLLFWQIPSKSFFLIENPLPLQVFQSPSHLHSFRFSFFKKKKKTCYCVCVCMMHALWEKALVCIAWYTCEGQIKLSGIVSSFPPLCCVSEVKLQSAGLHGKCLYAPSNLAGPFRIFLAGFPLWPNKSALVCFDYSS